MMDLTPKYRRKPGPKPKIKPVRPTLFEGNSRGPRPFMWITGPDPIRHQKYVAWQRARAQARFRHEPWDLTFEQFEIAWGESWAERGRTKDRLCMSRVDYEGGWSIDNVELLTRKEHNIKQQAWRRGQV